MKRKVRIVSRPKAQSGLEIKMSTAGMNSNQLSWPAMPGRFSAPDVKVKRVLPPTDKKNATLEAEDGETVLTNLQQDGIPEFYTIGGKRHHSGGTPLNLPPDSFIFSRDNSMKIKDESVQKMFGKTFKKGGYSPAEMSLSYDINKFREILADPNSDDLQRKTAEMMITNYNLKLGALALAQESIKGFPQGIPKVAMPYLEVSGVDPTEFVQTQGKRDDANVADNAKYGGLPKHQTTGQTGYDWGQAEGFNMSGLNTSDPEFGMQYKAKRRSPFGFSLNPEPNPVKDAIISGLDAFSTKRKNKETENWLEEHQGAQNLYTSVAGNKGDYLFDKYAGLDFRPDQTGSYSQQRGNVKLGGLPRHQTKGQVQMPLTEQIAWEKKFQDELLAKQRAHKKEVLDFRPQIEKQNLDNMMELRDLYDKMKAERAKGNLTSSWDWLPWTDDTAEEYAEAFTKTAQRYGYTPATIPALQQQLADEDKPVKDPNANELLRTRVNKKTGEVEQVNATGKVVAKIVKPNTVTAAKSAPVVIPTATAPVEKPKAKTTAPKAEADPYANMTTAELEKLLNE